MTKLTIIPLFFLCGGFGNPKEIPTTFLRETLTLDNKLSMFRSCSVEIVLNEILEVTSTGFRVDSYELSPFSYPIIISNYQYALVTDIRFESFMRCGEYYAPIFKNQEFKFVAPPNSRMNCFAMVHIAPKACKTWTHAQTEFEFREGFVMHRTYEVPETFLLTVFDHRIQKALAAAKKDQTKGDSTVDMNVNPPFKINKSGLILIHVEMYDSELDHTKIDYSESALFMMENVFQKIGYNVAAPTIPGRDKGAYILRIRPELTVKRLFQSFLATPNTSWQSFIVLHAKCMGGVRFRNMEFEDNAGEIRKWKGEDRMIHSAVVHSIFLNVTTSATMAKRHFDFLTFTTTEPITEVFFNTFNHAVHFITCASTETPGILSIVGYISAFDMPTWLMLLGGGLASGLLLHKFMLMRQKVLKSDWYSVSFVYNIILAQGTKFIHFEKWIGGSWIIVGVVITFFYQGENINRLTAPILPKRMQTFDELLNSNLTIDSVHSSMILIRMLNELTDSYRKQGHPEQVEGFYQMFEKSLSETVGDLMLFLQIYYVKHTNMTMNQIRKKLQNRMLVPHTFHEFIKELDSDYHFGKISKCGQNVLVATLGNIKELEGRLRLGGTDQENIVVSKTNFGFTYDSWTFEGVPWPSIAFSMKMRSLFHSGLVALWKGWIDRLKGWNSSLILARSTKVKVKGLSTSDNVVVVFYIHSAIIAVAMLAFCAEILERPLRRACGSLRCTSNRMRINNTGKWIAVANWSSPIINIGIGFFVWCGNKIRLFEQFLFKKRCKGSPKNEHHENLNPHALRSNWM
ncbi:unnamed protein product [Orchesella dallaii]|uniref:Uncharacterized protein n=1 Tax=Orchesella dallaii TaxID=48710 RepID=A0ABP1RK49_9HEXA